MTLADAGRDAQAQTEAAKAEKLLEPATWYLTRAYVDQAAVGGSELQRRPPQAQRWLPLLKIAVGAGG
ncbi:hypothetical protein, partial [Serratia marcescens]|uniref:hypothetical protein n=1 Tax=Serratia marcescens TaxID=615 RepID=UPI001E3E1449